MPSMSALLLSAAWLLSGCRQEAPRSDTVRVRDVVFVRQSLEVGADLAAVAAADLDADGHLDLAITGDGPFVTVFRGDGRGGLVRQARFPAGDAPVDVDLADLDGNGTVDMVIANHETDHLTILLGDGTGAFRAAPNSPLRIDVRPHPHAVRARDLDGDGVLDLVVDHRAGGGLLVLRGRGGGAFESPGTLVEMGGDPYRGMAIGDVNGDGRPDLVTPNPREVGVALSAAPSGMGFLPARSLPAAAPFAVELADLDADEDLDLVAASDEGSSVVEIFLGDGRGGFRQARRSHRAGPGGKTITRGDLDGDGVQDVAVSSFEAPEVLLLLGGSDSVRTARLPGGENPWGLAAADLNGDGIDDLVVIDAASPRVTLYLSRPKGS